MSELLDEVRNTLRVHHYAMKTEKSYVQWIRRFILFHKKRHPAETGKLEVEQFLTRSRIHLRLQACIGLAEMPGTYTPDSEYWNINPRNLTD